MLIKRAGYVTYVFLQALKQICDGNWSHKLCFRAAHESNVEERNSEFQRISQSLFCPKTPPPRLPACLKKISMEDESASTCKINGSKRAFEDSDLVVWLGDLNYRIQDNRNRVDDLINQNRYTVKLIMLFFLIWQILVVGFRSVGTESWLENSKYLTQMNINMEVSIYTIYPSLKQFNTFCIKCEVRDVCSIY